MAYLSGMEYMMTDTHLFLLVLRMPGPSPLATCITFDLIAPLVIRSTWPFP